MNFKKDNNLLNGKGENDIEWITVNGAHIPIKDGETPKQAIENKFKDKDSGNQNSTTSRFYKGKIDKNNESVLKSKVTETMNRIVKEKVEHNVVIDKDGNIFENVGDEEFVEDMNLNLTGAIDMHNHLEDTSFGEDDFNFMRNHVGTEFLNVTPKYIHRVKVIKEIDKPYNYFYIRGLRADEPDWRNQSHHIMECIKREGYIEYERIIRNT